MKCHRTRRYLVGSAWRQEFMQSSTRLSGTAKDFALHCSHRTGAGLPRSWNWLDPARQRSVPGVWTELQLSHIDESIPNDFVSSSDIPVSLSSKSMCRGILAIVTILTASYEGRSLEEFLANLRAQGVRLVADVREAPIS